MKSFFEIKDGCVVLSNEEAGKIIVYTLPNEEEKKELMENWEKASNLEPLLKILPLR